MAADLQSAETYFSPMNHIRAASWARYSEEQKTAALAQAARILARATGLTDVVTEIESDEWVNPTYAIFEQALFMLQNLPMTNSDETLAVPEASDPTSESKARKADTRLLAPEAVRWLTVDYGVEISRG